MTLEDKITQTEFEIINPIKNRWSPRAFDSKPVEKDALNRLFEAMRWAPSAMNEQPWRVLYAVKGEEAHDKIVNALNPGNQIWAKNAPVLIVTLISKYYSSTGQPNGIAKYDLGQAIGNMSAQATSEEIYLHQMGGYNRQIIIDSFQISEAFEPVIVIAAGYLGHPETLEEPFKTRELAERSRKPIATFVNHGTFNNQ